MVMTNTNRPRRYAGEHALDEHAAHAEVQRATLADRESREFGIEPLDATTAPKFSALGRERAIAAAVEQRRHEIAVVLGMDDALTGDPVYPANVKRTCKACGGGSVYLETRPDLEFCTDECAAHGPAIKKHITSVLEIDLSGVPMQDAERSSREHEGMGARETMNSVRRVLGMPTLPEDTVGVDPCPNCTRSRNTGYLMPQCKCPPGAAETALQRHRAERAELELRIARAENEALRAQIREGK